MLYFRRRDLTPLDRRIVRGIIKKKFSEDDYENESEESREFDFRSNIEESKRKIDNSYHTFNSDIHNRWDTPETTLSGPKLFLPGNKVLNNM